MKGTKMKKFYATLEGRPVIITDLTKATGYWVIDGKWVRMHPADVTQAGSMTQADFKKAFPDLPVLYPND